MTPHAIARLAARLLGAVPYVLVVGLLALGSAGTARASTGGASMPSTGTTGSGGSGGGASAGAGGSASQPAPQARLLASELSSTRGGITLISQPAGVLRQPMRFTGNVGARAAGKTVEIERRSGRGWALTTQAQVNRDGSFVALWPPSQSGRFKIRALVIPPRASAAAARVRTRTAAPSVTITVYQPGLATLYGPGFYGRKTACGETLRPTTVGVANRTLPCGTKVSILFAGKTLVVPVIDRGPYAHGASWDLTMATASALGMTGTEMVGAVALSPRPRSAPAAAPAAG